MLLKYPRVNRMKVFILLAVLLFQATCNYCQNLIGYKEREIQKYMSYNRKDMNFENVKNSRFRYLKYTDGSESQTLLFFLNKDSICHSVRLICDPRVKAEKIREFNSAFNKDGDNKWIEKRGGRDYIIEVSDEMYSCIITIKPED